MRFAVGDIFFLAAVSPCLELTPSVLVHETITLRLFARLPAFEATTGNLISRQIRVRSSRCLVLRPASCRPPRPRRGRRGTRRSGPSPTSTLPQDPRVTSRVIPCSITCGRISFCRMTEIPRHAADSDPSTCLAPTCWRAAGATAAWSPRSRRREAGPARTSYRLSPRCPGRARARC